MCLRGTQYTGGPARFAVLASRGDYRGGIINGAACIAMLDVVLPNVSYTSLPVWISIIDLIEQFNRFAVQLANVHVYLYE